MVRQITKTNPNLLKLIRNLRKKSSQEGAAIWKDVARRLERPTRRRAAVNLSKINRHSDENETVLVPGKVLGSGSLDHSVQVVALSFSKAARDKIERAGGECLTLGSVVEENQAIKNIKIIE
ncbi:50S ribosomal protein L18e [Methanothermobacter wolfeii]|uniref:Large ribosomal subunit protein eL18 n=1 Tax=Methanothermobacter wolfeii TaxID=145261 RepID=A0A9E7RTV0_METWO|nr:MULTISPECIES: 50S ribosomal protein L18e [Methanothermobacter]MDI6702397.1 50S ribosomal protein L18e [Methanothermobacter wolfeii]MDI6841968.1 50S ribosomal protein L18e [Methanothermobacter wolfeii]NLM03218.1 50S ribosomal protein L18e [Methanothermobacter wolfeii]QHN06017.1 50S ribosomal protein L18e [Methanothermobacter sp. THM-1]UXH32185.1 50S ribosomal protein L18e [Methanothermobacter wolfeii]